ncbi:uncharacterized protein LOC123306261 [Coccinella septempunctata]|uniref:uncharacterized protein LOC123306261 n=1 Tax=Coccinella septempunctata TaxID=41139 RepID=UPI001D05C54F|nr:uncharacterized protein LOC123306261 [Coccinella septempunctata]
MLWLTTSTLLLSLVYTSGKAITCKCWDGYKPHISKEGPECFGVQLMHIMPCNTPRAPRCVCTGEVNNILKDRTGTWCSTMKNGKELKRWPCENTRDWDEFFARYPDFN